MADLKLLIVEDDADDLRMIKSSLDRDKSRTYTIEHCTALGAAMDLLGAEQFDAVILDLGLPDSKGLETLTTVQEHNIQTPMVILTDLDDEDFAEQALRLGFEEYVPKSALRSSRIDWQIRQAVERHKVTRLYYERATVDSLTGVYNRAYFDEILEREISKHARSGERMALVLIDLDEFKHLNDTFGHAAGDSALKALGQSLKECKRREDLAARLGGDEFALLLSHISDDSGPEQLFDRIRSMYEDRCKNLGLEEIPTLSIGVAWYRAPMTAGQFYQRADHAMYQAKKLGKNGLIILND